MILKVGGRYRSVVCATEFVVVRAPREDVDVRCGGTPVVSKDDPSVESGALAAHLAEGTLVGKRYRNEAIGLELLVTKAGEGTLSIGEDALERAEAKALPSSD